MNTRKLHHIWTRIRPIRPWYFFALAALCLVMSLFTLRANYMHMQSLRDAVYAADKDNGDVKGALNNLQRYVTTHMNTSLTKSNSVYPPIQLQYTYERLREADLSTNNSKIYTEAQAYCEQQNGADFSGRNRVPCIENYVESHGAFQQTIPDSLYKYDFVSPSWSPDLAGFSVVLTFVSALVGLSWTAARRWLKSHTS